MADNQKQQFSVLSVILLTAAIAIWLTLFREASASELAIFASTAAVAGVLAHLAYTYVLAWRVTAAVTVLLVYNLALVLLLVWNVGLSNQLIDRLDLLADIVMQPAAIVTRVRSIDQVLSIGPLVLVTAIYTPAHAVRPSLPTAIITALGIGAWYAAGILILSQAG